MNAEPFIIGWLEWLALPELGLPAVKAKVDTGARSSALHAFLIEPFGPADEPMVRFGVHPIPGRLDVAVFASAPIVDRREVTSSNGERETRYFIRTQVRLGDREWDIEVGLTNRESMSYRMLLGRQAIRDDMMVDVATSFRQPRLSYKLYRGMPRATPEVRALRIGLLVDEETGSFNRSLAKVARERGHTLEVLEFGKLALSFSVDAAEVRLDGDPLPHYDAVIPRIGRRNAAVGAAIVRQLEATGSVSLNPGDAIDRLLNKVAAAQVLVRHRVGQALCVDGSEAGALGSREAGLRVLVVGDAAVAMIAEEGSGHKGVSMARHRAARRLAERAADALGLGLAVLEIVEIDGRPLVAAVSARPALSLYARGTSGNVAAAIIAVLEQRIARNAPDVRREMRDA